MVNPPENQTPQKAAGLTKYATQHVATVAVFILMVVWAFNWIPGASAHDEKPVHDSVAIDVGRDRNNHGETIHLSAQATTTGQEDAPPHTGAAWHAPTVDAGTEPDTKTNTPDASDASTDNASRPTGAVSDHGATGDEQQSTEPPFKANKTQDSAAPAPHAPLSETDRHGQDADHDAAEKTTHDGRPPGVSFVEATIKSLNDELNHRFWGWRPNDIVNLTDNVNNFQLGVLEVTRRTVVQLAERLSRTGTTDAFNPHLENSMNWLMVKASRYWFPAPEAKYKESIQELEAYKENLINGNGSFYTRTDNLIPLLSSYEDLLGSCDENLVKQKNTDGKGVSTFKADDYFYYAQGVASTLASILEAVHHDFLKTLESRHAAELLHHALASCRQAAALDPILITNGDLDGILANHRANMAAPISHARFYISQLIKTLST